MHSGSEPSECRIRRCSGVVVEMVGTPPTAGVEQDKVSTGQQRGEIVEIKQDTDYINIFQIPPKKEVMVLF